MANLILTFVMLFGFLASPQQDNCRNRLSYLHFEEMTQKERLLWLNCAFEKFKNGDDSSLKQYVLWNKKAPSYAEFKTLWAKLNAQKTE